MKPIEGFDLISEAGELVSLKKGIYGLEIKDVVDVPDREYLEIYFDITKGEFANYYATWKANDGKDHSKTIRSYKTSALPFFKAFTTAVEKSNPGYHWDWDEKKLIGKKVIGVFGEEEYVKEDKTIGVVVRIQDFRSLEAYQKGEIQIPELKKLSDADKLAAGVGVANNTASIEVSDDDLPF